MKKYKSFIEFAHDFSTREQCLSHLCDLKWGDGYTCRKCGHNVPVKGRTWYYRKCQKCHYDESCTSNTLLHKLKFSIVKAFWITYQLGTMKKGMSTAEIARQYEIHQETAWYFKRKIQQAMAASESALLGGNVEVDEMVIGGMEAGKPGRSHGKKKLVEVAVEIDYPDDSDQEPIMKRAKAVIIDNASSSSLKQAIDSMLEPDCVITTDQWSAYPAAIKDRVHLAYPSEKGANFPHLHWHNFNIKNWLRGIHHRISAKHAQRYLDEYHYRFNRRNFTHSNPTHLLSKMIKEPWMPYKTAVGT